MTGRLQIGQRVPGLMRESREALRGVMASNLPPPPSEVRQASIKFS